jgi:hypothetical protein
MRRILLALSVLCMIFAAMSPCFADTSGKANGVLVQERIINLPNDQGKWYISIVGDSRDAQYQTILKWFREDADLYKLRKQVHYIPVATEGRTKAVYLERYKPNIEGLPTVRMQNNQGVVIYEAAGDELPFTPDGLYGAMANNVMLRTQCRRPIRPILPWRREMERRCPCPSPDPAPEPDDDPEPEPIDDGGPPDIAPQSSLPPLWLMLATLVLSAGAGAVVEWRKTYAEK